MTTSIKQLHSPKILLFTLVIGTAFMLFSLSFFYSNAKRNSGINPEVVYGGKLTSHYTDITALKQQDSEYLQAILPDKNLKISMMKAPFKEEGDLLLKRPFSLNLIEELKKINASDKEKIEGVQATILAPIETFFRAHFDLKRVDNLLTSAKLLKGHEVVVVTFKHKKDEYFGSALINFSGDQRGVLAFTVGTAVDAEDMFQFVEGML
jgi:hypothetical protein